MLHFSPGDRLSRLLRCYPDCLSNSRNGRKGSAGTPGGWMGVYHRERSRGATNEFANNSRPLEGRMREGLAGVRILRMLQRRRELLIDDVVTEENEERVLTQLERALATLTPTDRALLEDKYYAAQVRRRRAPRRFVASAAAGLGVAAIAFFRR